MFDKLKMKYAAKRMQQKRDFSAEKKYIDTNATRLARIILWPLRMVGRAIRWTWDTICAVCFWMWSVLCEINLVGLINLALLIAIIVLCSMLIIDILNCRVTQSVNSSVVKPVPVEFTKNKIQECISYLNILENILENKSGEHKISVDDLNKISYMISQLEPILNDKEIVEAINKDINKKYKVDSLAQLLDVQLALSDKIRVLIQ